MTRSELLRNGVSLQTELAKSLPLIRGHRTELQQVILNLIVNALIPRRLAAARAGRSRSRNGASTAGFQFQCITS